MIEELRALVERWRQQAAGDDSGPVRLGDAAELEAIIDAHDWRALTDEQRDGRRLIVCVEGRPESVGEAFVRRGEWWCIRPDKGPSVYTPDEPTHFMALPTAKGC